jgi:hypothetical protein
MAKIRLLMRFGRFKVSLLDSFKKRSVLDTALKNVAQARKSANAAQAAPLFDAAYQGFAKVIADNLIFSEALYHWGFALLHQARAQTPEQATATYEDAISKFSFCLLTAPHYLGAAIDGGVAIMELARISATEARGDWYRLAESFFTNANAIQKGSASYNLACIEALRGDEAACQAALREARSFGSLPDIEAIVGDDDLQSVKDSAWFKDLIEEWRRPPQAASEDLPEEAVSLEPSFKLKKTEDFDYYSDSK